LLDEQEVERLDEASIVDDDVAARLRSVEDDLVDAYVADALEPDTRARFESVYLASPLRREKVRFAQRFVPAVSRAASSGVATVDEAAARMKVEPEPRKRSGDRRARWMSVWSVGIAALIFLAMGVLLQDRRLRQQVSRADSERASSIARQESLTRELDRSRTALAEAGKALDRTRAALAEHGQPAAAGDPPLAVALVLLPQTRAMTPVETIAIAPGARRLPLVLRLESNDYQRYQVLVKDVADNDVVWRSGILAARERSGDAFVPVAVPADVLRPQHYSVELVGLDPAGHAATVGSYTFLIER
jgi:hypothetical protein